jgi:hypothetical protein
MSVAQSVSPCVPSNPGTDQPPTDAARVSTSAEKIVVSEFSTCVRLCDADGCV